MYNTSIVRFHSGIGISYTKGKIMIIRHATINDLTAIAAVESECFPPLEAASKTSIEKRLQHYPECFWLLYENDTLISFVNGMSTDSKDLTDEMYDNASMHNPNGKWQMIFGVDTIPSRRKQGKAALLLDQAIADSRQRGKLGLVLTCKDKLIHYYAKFGFINEGISSSVHGNVTWYQMRLTF